MVAAWKGWREAKSAGVGITIEHIAFNIEKPQRIVYWADGDLEEVGDACAGGCEGRGSTLRGELVDGLVGLAIIGDPDIAVRVDRDGGGFSQSSDAVDDWQREIRVRSRGVRECWGR
jgi:hypothetical protein